MPISRSAGLNTPRTHLPEVDALRTTSRTSVPPALIVYTLFPRVKAMRSPLGDQPGNASVGPFVSWVTRLFGRSRTKIPQKIPSAGAEFFMLNIEETYTGRGSTNTMLFEAFQAGRTGLANPIRGCAVDHKRSLTSVRPTSIGRPFVDYWRAKAARASAARSVNDSPLTSIRTRLIVPPTNGQGASPT